MTKLSLVAAVICSSMVSHAQILHFSVSLSGPNVVPPTGSSAIGSGTFELDTVTRILSANVSYSGLAADAYASHVHLGAAGATGPVAASFTTSTPSATSGSIVGSAPSQFETAYIPNLIAGNTYCDIHDPSYPGGEIRGQLIVFRSPSPQRSAC